MDISFTYPRLEIPLSGKWGDGACVVENITTDQIELKNSWGLLENRYIFAKGMPLS